MFLMMFLMSSVVGYNLMHIIVFANIYLQLIYFHYRERIYGIQ
jgi:hypothetical protein